MANGGSFEGKTLLSPEAWEELHSAPTIDKCTLFNIHTCMTKGGLGKFGVDQFSQEQQTFQLKRHNTGRDGFFGWFGYGGSVMQWNPELKIGFAYVPAEFNVVDLLNEKGALIQDIVLKCAKGEEIKKEEAGKTCVVF
jgi:CubicO group peptidase (beta-lactamase class C family)